MRKAREEGWKPAEPDRIAGDSRNTINGINGLSRIKNARLQKWSAGVLAALQDQRREVDIFVVPRSANGMADHGAGQAVKMVASLMGAVHTGYERMAMPGLRLTCNVLDVDNRPVVVFDKPLDGLTVGDIEYTCWREQLL